MDMSEKSKDCSGHAHFSLQDGSTGETLAHAVMSQDSSGELDGRGLLFVDPSKLGRAQGESSKGPAQVATPNYRTQYARIFGADDWN